MTSKKSTRKDTPQVKDAYTLALEKRLAQLEKKLPKPASNNPDYVLSHIGTYSRLYFHERTNDELHESLRQSGWARHSFRKDDVQVWYYSRYGTFTKAQLTVQVGYAPSKMMSEEYVPFRKARR